MSNKNRGEWKNGKSSTFRTTIIIAIVLVVGAYGIYRMTKGPSVPDARVAFAQCLTEKGVKMYGAYWCPHCQSQKKAFGKGFSKITYVECAVPGSTANQTQTCKDANIESYPTWEFSDGSRVVGQQSFEQLAQKSGCAYASQ